MRHGLEHQLRIGKTGALIQVNNAKAYCRGRGRTEKAELLPAVCTNPLTWTSDDTAAPASAKGAGSLPEIPGDALGIPSHAQRTLEPSPWVADMTRRRMQGQASGLWTWAEGWPKRLWHDALSFLFGSYRARPITELFYTNIRSNAVDRVDDAWMAAQTGDTDRTTKSARYMPLNEPAFQDISGSLNMMSRRTVVADRVGASPGSPASRSAKIDHRAPPAPQGLPVGHRDLLLTRAKEMTPIPTPGCSQNLKPTHLTKTAPATPATAYNRYEEDISAERSAGSFNCYRFRHRVGA